jgi:hypothetical protein
MRNLSKWVKKLKNQPISLIIVHDKSCIETSSYISEITKSLDVEQFVVVSGVFGSPGAARNAGLEIAQTEWIVFWDSDDVGEPENLLQAITKHAESSILVGGFTLNYDLDERVCRQVSIKDTKDKYLQMASQGGLWRYIIKREVIGSKRFTSNMMGEDLLFLIELDLFNREVTMCGMIFYNYYYGSSLHLTSSRKYQAQVESTFNQLQSRIRSQNRKLNLFETGVYFKLLFSVCKYSTTLRKVQSLSQTVMLLLIKRLIIMKSFLLFLQVLWMNTRRTVLRSSKSTVRLNLTGGLGNQLFQIAAALALSQEKRIFVEKSIGQPRTQPSGVSDVEAFDLPGRVVFGETKEAPRTIKRILNLSLRGGISSSRNISRRGSKLINKVSSLCLSLYLKEWRNIVTPQGIGFAPLIMPRNPFLVGYFQSYKWPETVYSELMSIRLKKTTPELQELISSAKNNKPIMVHVRLGDYVSIDSFGIPSRKYYNEAIRYIIESTSLQNIWLFSNEPEKARKWLPKEYESHILVISDSAFTPAETLEIMRHCHGYVIANSTFSWWGAYLSYNNLSLKVGPNPWFRGEPSPKDIIPESWKTFQAFEELT